MTYMFFWVLNRHFPVISDSGSYRSDTSQPPSEHDSDFARIPLVCSQGVGSVSGRSPKQQIGAIVHPQARPPPPPAPGSASPTKVQQRLQQV